VGERTPSATTNAHVLEAVTDWLDLSPDPAWPAAAAAKVSGWLCAEQSTDGTWTDKWHASPYYATVCCAVALARVGGPGPDRAVGRAIDWVLATQRDDGSWGRWAGTAEETAYAVEILLLPAGRADRDRVDRAAARGYLALTEALRRPTDCPPLWHDKDLYLPGTIVQAAGLRARHLVHGSPTVLAQVAQAAPAERGGADG
jgi:hypothetical protein